MFTPSTGLAAERETKWTWGCRLWERGEWRALSTHCESFRQVWNEATRAIRPIVPDKAGLELLQNGPVGSRRVAIKNSNDWQLLTGAIAFPSEFSFPNVTDWQPTAESRRNSCFYSTK